MVQDEGLSYSELSVFPEVRVSCAAFADIVFNNRRCLIINRTRWEKKGERVLTPVGGAIELTSIGTDELVRLLEIDRSAFEDGLDLRFIMHGKHANDLREWFLSRRNREVSPERELREELIGETGLLTVDDFRGIKYGQPGYQTELAATDIAGQEGRLTLRLIEVYSTTFNAGTLSKLLDAAEKPESMIKFVSDQEILAGLSTDGLKVALVARALIRPNNSI